MQKTLIEKNSAYDAVLCVHNINKASFGQKKNKINNLLPPQFLIVKRRSVDCIYKYKSTCVFVYKRSANTLCTYFYRKKNKFSFPIHIRTITLIVICNIQYNT